MKISLPILILLLTFCAFPSFAQLEEGKYYDEYKDKKKSTRLHANVSFNYQAPEEESVPCNDVQFQIVNPYPERIRGEFRVYKRGCGADTARISFFDVPFSAEPRQEIRKTIRRERVGEITDIALTRLTFPEIDRTIDRQGNTRLHQAARRRETLEVAYLVSKGADANLRNRQGFTPLHLAEDANTLLALLQSPEVFPNVVDNAGRTPLFDAVDKDRFKKVKVLLEAGASVNLPDTAGTHVLYPAVYNGQTDMIELLLRYGANPNAGLEAAILANKPFLVADFLDYDADPDWGIAPAVYTNNTDMARLLLRNYAHQDTLLRESVIQGNMQMATLALERNARPDKFLYLTAGFNDLPMAELLLERGASPNSAMDEAIADGSSEFLKLLIEKGADTQKPNYIKTAVKKERYEITEVLVQNGANPNEGMRVALEKENLPILRLLLFNKADASPPQYIDRAAKKGNIEITQLLLDYGANANDGMLGAIENQREDILQLLLEREVQADLPQFIDLAAQKGNLNVVTMLVQKGAVPDEGMLGAATKGKSNIITYLLEKGADGTRPQLMEAAINGRSDIVVSQLIEAGGDATPPQYLGIAVTNADERIVRILLGENADMSYRNPNGENLLHIAVDKQSYGVVQALIFKKEFINEKSNFGNTPLHLAVKKRRHNLDITQLLVTNGADINAKDGSGDRVRKVARQPSKKYLKQLGAKKK